MMASIWIVKDRLQEVLREVTQRTGLGITDYYIEVESETVEYHTELTAVLHVTLEDGNETVEVL